MIRFKVLEWPPAEARRKRRASAGGGWVRNQKTAVSAWEDRMIGSGAQPSQDLEDERLRALEAIRFETAHRDYSGAPLQKFHSDWRGD